MTNIYPSAAESNMAFDANEHSGPQVMFGEPQHTDGFVFGFLFRFVVAALAILTGTVFLFFYAAVFTHWHLTASMLGFFGAGITVMIFLGEHIRSRVYERIIGARPLPDTRIVAKDQLAITQSIENLKTKKISPASLVAKRLFDIQFSVAGLIILTPLLILIAAFIKLDSRGPILFYQRRYGFDGRQIRILKFRTMMLSNEGKLSNQGRITRVGWWLRQLSLDELPQLLNVLGGGMSIVGPRPYIGPPTGPLDESVFSYANRQHIKPGITGWAQVHGYRGMTYSQVHYDAKTKLDLWYIDNWSLSLDVKIILATIFWKSTYSSRAD